MGAYEIVVGQSASFEPDHGSDEALAADLFKTVTWIDEVIEEYRLLDPKIQRNTDWFTFHDMSHPRYEDYAEVFKDQKDTMFGLLDRMRALDELGAGEVARMSKEGEKKYRDLVKQFIGQSTWIRERRSEVAQREGLPF